MIEKFKRIKLGHFPTPIEYLKNISKYLDGPNIFIKRDDCTGLIGLIKNKKFTKNDNVLFIHTGAAVSLFAYEWAFNK